MIVNSCVLKLPRAINPQVLLRTAEERGMPGLLWICRTLAPIPHVPPLCTNLHAYTDQDLVNPPIRMDLVPHQTATLLMNLALMLPPETLLLLSRRLGST